ncbi:MAG: hypothetical protein B7Y57_29120 [Rhodospirillales bacterium 35-66-84]|nr:MAG: hypothetical protein B7Y57_29120 [Rhodospirillales bacterium 35-66-84]
MDGNVNPALTDLVDILKSRQIKRIQYFHADHFEPWSLGLNEKTARGVARFGEMSRASPFGHKHSLFYCPYVPYHLDAGRAAGRSEGDAVVFGSRSADQERIAREVIRFDNSVSRWVNAHSTAAMDKARLDSFFVRCKEVIGAEIGRRFDRWAFVHGNWALAASDPLICTIDSELSMIMRHGGFGDFSFPAGRGYCDPKLSTPFTCLPLDLVRAYDDPAADPRPVEAGTATLQPDRFFIWNSPIKAKHSSIDFYSEPNRELFKSPDRLLSEWLSGSVSFGDDLFLKTHAHSMKWEYKISEEGSLIPHCYPDVVKIFERLLRICDQAGVEFRVVSVDEVMACLHSFDGTSAASSANQPTGQLALSELPANVSSVLDGAVATRKKKYARAGATKRTGEPAEQRARSRKADSDEVSVLDRDIVAILRGWVSSDPKREETAGDYYRDLLSRDHILQDYERAVLEYIVANIPATGTRIVEVGVGFGVLSLLLAVKGYEVVAFEGDRSRFAGLEFLFDRFAERMPEVRARLRPVLGWFPDALDPSMLGPDRRNLLLTTNIVATASAKRQELILYVARKFDDLIIDTTRFGVRRYDADSAKNFQKEVAVGYRTKTSVWRKEPNEIWHFRAEGGDAEGPPGRSEALANNFASKINHSNAEGRAVPMNFGSFTTELLSLQRDWMGGEGADHQPDDLYTSKLARGVALEAYEVAIASAIVERFDRDTSFVEIGSGYGALALRLAQDGFVVRGCEGDRRRSAGFAWHLREYLARYPQLAGRVDCTPGFFPDVIPSSLKGKEGRHICIATNVTCTYTATHQSEILDAVKDFDELIVDLSRFGKSRNTQEERDALREAMAKSHFEPVERLYFAAPYEYWRFRVRPQAKQASAAKGTVTAQSVVKAQAQAPVPTSAKSQAVALQSTDQVFPLRGTGGVLYSVYGNRQIDACPICHGGNTVGLWRMPMTALKEPISLFGGYFNQVPTLQVPTTIYCFDFCRDCETVFLNPAPESQKAQYRKSDHYLRTMQGEGQWKGYENNYDRFSKWIPEGATVLMDAACGIGQYLEVARKRAPDRWRRLIGLELSEKYVAHMRTQGLEAYAFDIDNDDLGQFVEPECVDFITFSEAFEHVERPLDALTKLLKTLRPGGRLYFTAQRYGTDVQSAVRPGEPIYIGEKVMKDLPERLGCRVVDVTTSGMRYYVVLEK